MKEDDCDAQYPPGSTECLVGNTSSNGQRCTAIKLIMVHRSIAEAFNEKFVAAVASLSAGVPFGKNAITPSVQRYHMNELTEDAKSKAAIVIKAEQGGAHWDRSLFFLAVAVTAELELWHVEQVGPVIPIATFDDLAEPMAWLEKMHFCQQSAIFTSQSEDAPSAELAELLDVRCQHADR